MKHNQTKYRLEKVLHELIRDLPEAAAINHKLERGFLTPEDAFYMIAETIREERERSKTA